MRTGRTRPALLALAAAASLVAAPGALAAPGDRDPAFDADGIVTTTLGPSTAFDVANALAIQPDGKIVVAGQSDQTATATDFALARYNPNGSLDTSFGGGDGIQITPVAPSASSDVAFAVAIQPDGKIVAAGQADMGNGTTGFDFAVVRYLPDGTPDPTFDGDGIRTDPMSGGNQFDTARAVAVAGGKIVVAGSATVANPDEDFALIRYDSSGTPDGTFNGTGKVTTPIASGTGSDRAQGVAVLPDGRILAAGRSAMGGATGRDFSAVRYTDAGGLDGSFDTDGKATLSIAAGSDNGSSGNGSDSAFGLAVQPDGKAVLAGQSISAASGADFSIARLDTAGQPDPSFDGDGSQLVQIGPGTAADLGRSVTLQPDGKVVVGGHANLESGNRDFAFVRLNTNGSLDPSFSGDGIQTHGLHGPPSFDEIGQVALQADGKIVGAGTSDVPGAGSDLAVIRMIGDQADISVTGTAPARIGPRLPFDYTLTVANNGPNPALGVTLVDALPSALGLRSARTTQGTCTNAQTVTCAIGDLSVGGNVTVRITVAGRSRLPLTNRPAAAASWPGDPNLANNVASLDTRIANPSLSGFSFAPKVFQEGSLLPKASRRRRVRKGTRIRFRLSQPARVRLTFFRARRGRKVGRRCRKPTRRLRSRRRCTRYVRVRGSISASGKAGRNTIRFQGRLTRRRRLRPGRYLAKLQARDSAGNRSTVKKAKFRLVRRHRRRR